MTLREPLKMKKISGNETRRHYVRHYTGLPAALVGNAMDKEHFLNDLTTKTLDILGVHRRRRKLVTIQ